MLQAFHSRFKLILIWSHPLYKKMRFPIKDFFSKCDQIRSFKFIEEILNGKLHFLCCVHCAIVSSDCTKFIVSLLNVVYLNKMYQAKT